MHITKGGKTPCTSLNSGLSRKATAPMAAPVAENKAVNLGDLAAYQFPAMQRKIARALAEIEQAAQSCGAIGIAFSTGKDSLVVFDLVRQVLPAAPAAYYHSGNETEFSDNLALCQHYGVDVIYTEQTLADLCRDYGYWGYTARIECDDVNFGAFMVGEPAYRFIEQQQLNCIALGLRAQENSGRAANERFRGHFYPVNVPQHPNFYHLTPIANWTHDDVWAYIAGRELRYNPIYDAMAAAGIPRAEQRVSTLLGMAFSNHGRYQYLRMTAPELWRNLANQFPALRRLS